MTSRGNESRGICEYEQHECNPQYNNDGSIYYPKECYDTDFTFCPAGFYYNDRVDDCVPGDYVDCGPGYFYDYGRDRCEAEHFCGDEEYWDEGRQMCVDAFLTCPAFDPIPCPPGYYNEPTQNSDGCWLPGECVRETVQCPNRPFSCPFGTYRDSFVDQHGCEQFSECLPAVCPQVYPRFCEPGEVPVQPDPNEPCGQVSCIEQFVCAEYYYEECPVGQHREFYKDPSGCGIPGDCVDDEDGERDYCGDNQCNNGETALTCPSDCTVTAACKTNVYNAFSGSQKCNYNACPSGCLFDGVGCPFDCIQDASECGDNSCDPGESFDSCPADCGEDELTCPSNVYNGYSTTAKCDYSWCASGCDFSADGCPLGCTYVAGGCGSIATEDSCSSSPDCEWYSYDGGAYCQPRTSFCGNDYCEAGETSESCPADCEYDNTRCESAELCYSESSCYQAGWFWCSGKCTDDSSECNYSYCGDGQCNAYESQANCPSDCGYGEWCRASIYNGNSFSTECNYAYCQQGCSYDASGCPSGCQISGDTCSGYVTDQLCNQQPSCEWYHSYSGASYCQDKTYGGYCGDGQCGENENGFSCPIDCGYNVSCSPTIYNGNSNTNDCNFGNCPNGCDYDGQGCPYSCSADVGGCGSYQSDELCSAAAECAWFESPTGYGSYCYYQSTGGFCGDQICNSQESFNSCPSDCEACTEASGCTSASECESIGAFWCDGACKSTALECSCGNNTCDANENESICPADCAVPVSCGNLICDSGESSVTCPSDCQILTTTCPATVYNAFGSNNACDPGYCSFGCSYDGSGCPVGCQTSSTTTYCGNYTCDPGESQSNCPIDCGSVLTCPSTQYNGYTEFFGCDYSFCPNGCLTDDKGCPSGCRVDDFVYCTDYVSHDACEQDLNCDWYTSGSGLSYCSVSSYSGGNCPSTRYNNYSQGYSCNYGLCPSGCDFDGSGCPVGCYGSHSGCDNDGICDPNESSFSCPADCSGYTQCESTIYNNYTNSGSCNFNNCPSGCNFGSDGCPFECTSYGTPAATCSTLYTEADCTSQGCDWHTDSYGAYYCYESGPDGPFCADHSTVDACRGQWGCIWDAASSDCYYPDDSSDVYCGNNVCDGGESPSSCPGDCPYYVSDCSATDGWACTSSQACTAVNWYWCEGACYNVECNDNPLGCDNDGYCELQYGENYENCPNDCQAGSCDRNNGLAHYCLSPGDCGDQGYSWCYTNSRCYWSSSECPGANYCGDSICDADESAASCPTDCNDTSGPSNCGDYSSEPSCTAVTNCYWSTYSSGSYCYYSESGPASEDTGVCDTDHMWNCTENECVSIGYFWCSGGCSSYNWCGESNSGSSYCGDYVCDANENSSNCEYDCGASGTTCSESYSYCYTESECTGSGFTWCSNWCMSAGSTCPSDSGSSYPTCPDNGYNYGGGSGGCNYDTCPSGCNYDSSGCPSSCISSASILSGESTLAYEDLNAWQRFALNTELVMSKFVSWAKASVGF